MSRQVELAAREPRIFRALAAVPVTGMLPPPGSRGARAAGWATGRCRIRTLDPPFAVLLRRGFVIVASDPLREVRMARTISPFGAADPAGRRHRLRGGGDPAGVRVGARVAVAPVGSGSVLTASFDLCSRGFAGRLVTMAVWPVIERLVSASLDRWLSAVGAEAAR